MPGIIEAEDYDNGGEGVAYHDTVPGNQGGAYRNDDVDIETIAGGYTLAYIRDTEWTQYTVTVQEAGDYRFAFRAAAWNGPRTIRILSGGTEIGNVTIPQTASSTMFMTAETTLRLGAGRQTLRLAFTGDSTNLDRVETALAPPTPTPTPNETPTSGILPVPGGIDVPTDTDGNGLYDDVNGNGRKDFADVVLYFNQMIWITTYEPVAAFDYNGNGRIDFADVVQLFNTL